jgi:signal peptide peptidase SppA
MSMHRYQPRSPLQAIEPQAFFMLFAEPEKPENEGGDDATIVTIRGPLSQHDDWWQDSYEAIRARVDEACQQAAPVVVLRIDSPGGDVLGCFDTARYIRTACERAGKRLLAHTEGQCCSAAYALATAAEKIVASSSAQIGSIGVIAARMDQTRALEDMGLKVELITSGDRKADGAAFIAMEKDERRALQADLGGLSAEFFNLVALRRGLSAADVEALEAGSFRGQAAVDHGLVDELGSFDHLLASLGASAAEGNTMSKMDEARDALRSAADDEECSDEDREKARKALAALDEEPAKDDEGEDKPADDKPADDAEGEEDDREASAAAGTVSASTAGALAAHGSALEQRLTKLEARDEARERTGMIAAHGGVPAGMAKLLASKPVAEVRAILAELPKPKRPKLGDAAATAVAAGVRGKDQDKASQLPPDEAKAMRLAMGLDKEKFGVVNRGNVQILGASLDEEVR